MATSTLGRSLMVASQLFYGIGSLVADYSPSHILNPNWPPHAKFHNGQTMSLSTMLSITSLYLLFRSRSSTSSSSSPQHQQQDLDLAAWVGSLYMLAGLSAIWYPGTAWLDPEWRKDRAVDEPAQLYVFSGGLLMCWVGWWIARKALGAGHVGGKRQ